jgi:hypothetical protein
MTNQDMSGEFDFIYDEPVTRGLTTDYLDQHIISDFIEVSGRHCGIFGMSGSGKTQLSYMLVPEFLNRNATVAWFDTGKSSEVLKLLDFHDIHFIMLEGHDVEPRWVKGKEDYEKGITKTFVQDEDEAMASIIKNTINIICIRPFYTEPEEASQHTAEFMKSLIEHAARYSLPDDMVLFLDELQHIAPAQGYELNMAHKKAGTKLAHNIDQLRSWGVRIVGMGQDWGKVLKSVRSQFPVLMIKRGVFFYKDDPHLSLFNSLWKALPDDRFVYVNSRKTFTEPIACPFYGDGKELGQLRYIKRS